MFENASCIEHTPNQSKGGSNMQKIKISMYQSEITPDDDRNIAVAILEMLKGGYLEKAREILSEQKEERVNAELQRIAARTESTTKKPA